MADLAVSTVLATEIEIAEFRTELDSYRAATIESLMLNEQQLVEVRARLDAMLAQAYVLPDGRRVFKTEDGQRVFDEHGEEVGADLVDPDMIEDWRPRAESYLSDREAERELVENRDRKLDLLDRMDAMDERLEEGDLTEDDLADMREELAEFAPEDIKQQVLGVNYQAPLELDRDFANAANPIRAVMDRAADISLEQ
ncbi:MAG: hypothetical protein KDK08_29665 [Rhizobiaceae bacterium]|nr:hypothetical protein [Rhizobiaceae bacterium]